MAIEIVDVLIENGDVPISFLLMFTRGYHEANWFFSTEHSTNLASMKSPQNA